VITILHSGPGSSVGIATGYGLDYLGIESQWGRDFPYLSSLLCNGYRVFPRSKERPQRDAAPSPLLVPWSRKSRDIPLLPLWVVGPVQSLSADTRVHFTLPYRPSHLSHSLFFIIAKVRGRTDKTLQVERINKATSL